MAGPLGPLAAIVKDSLHLGVIAIGPIQKIQKQQSQQCMYALQAHIYHE